MPSQIDKDANMFPFCLKLVAYSSLILMTACSSLNTKAVEKVQSVAFVGFDVDLSAKSISQTQNSDQLARALQKSVKDSFKEALSWHITENAKLANNSVYQGFYHQYKSRLLRGGLVEDSQLRQAEAARLNFEEREQLIQSLKVDAIATMYISTPTHKEIVNNGKTSKFYEANINFALYEKGSKDSIWQAYGVIGNSEIPLTYATPDKKQHKSDKAESLTLSQMLNGGGIKNSIEKFLSAEQTPALINKKFEIVKDAIDVSTGLLINQYQLTTNK
jgi:hypothetical protein